MIEVKNITKGFGGKNAIEDISFEVGIGSIYGLVGFNGAGKTTLLKCIAGVYKPDSGEALIDSKNTFTCPAIRQKMFFAADSFLFPESTMYKTGKFFAGYFPNFSFEMLDKLCGVFGIDKNARLTSFSKGMLRQAELIAGFSAMPEVLLLDESFDGLDPAKRNLMNNLIIDYTAEKNCSVIISSHNLHEISDICDRVALIDGKKIRMDRSVDDIGADRCKFRLVFDAEKNESDFSGFNIKKIKCEGKMVTLSLIGSKDENEAKLREMNPLLIEKFPLSLEEIFLEEMEGSDYDFREIFS